MPLTHFHIYNIFPSLNLNRAIHPSSMAATEYGGFKPPNKQEEEMIHHHHRIRSA